MNIRQTVLPPYSYDPTRRGAPYLFKGKHMNSGEFLECAVKYAYGVPAEKDASARFDITSDMPKYNASIKSAKATLTTVHLGTNRDEIISNYFLNTASSLFIWAYTVDDSLYMVEMNTDEFKEFIERFSYLSTTSDGYKTVIRFKITSMKMIKWFEAHI